MSKLWLWIIGGLFAIIVVLTGYVLYQYEWEEVSLVVGLQKEARKDPVFTLNRLLEKNGSSIERREDFTTLIDPLTKQILEDPSETGLLVDETLFQDDDELMQSLYSWAGAGGHLIYVVSSSRSDEQSNWLYEQISPGIVRTEDAEKPIYDISGDSDEINARLFINDEGTGADEELKIYMPYRFVLEECNNFVWEVLDDDYQTLVCHQPVGTGSVTLLSDPSFFNGFGLRIADNASLATMIFTTKANNFYFEGDTSIDWINLLFGQYWAIYTLSGVVIMLAFWNLFVRFGPALTPIRQGYSHFGQHLEALGNFYRQSGHQEELKRVLLVELDTIMEQKVSGFIGANNETKIRFLVNNTAASEVFARNLLNIKNITDNALWLEQVRFVKKIKV